MLICNISNAVQSKTTKQAEENVIDLNLNSQQEVSDTIINLISTINSEGMTQTLMEDTISLYTKVSEKYTNQEIAEIIEESKEQLIENGVSNEDIDSITKVLETLNEEQTKKILEAIDVDEIYKKIANGTTLQEILKDIADNMTTTDKVDLVVDLILSGKIIKTIIITILILFVYRTLLRCVIYKKAGKKAWASFVPIYRNIVMLKICQMSPWWLLLLLIPIVGWAFLWVISVASKFMLAENFGKGPIFAFGLWLLAPIFETILVCSWNTKYIGDEQEEPI